MRKHFESGLAVCKALYKYDDWKVSILHTCKSRDVANTLEIEEIRNFNSVAPNGYNLTHGGKAFSNPSNETRKKIGLAVSKRNMVNNPMQDAETAKKQGLAQRGIQSGKKNGRYKSGKYTKIAKLKRMQDKAIKLQDQLKQST